MSQPVQYDALVTGAGSPHGIGFAIAKRLAEGGLSVALVSTTDRIYDRASELTILGYTAHGFICDLTDFDATQALAHNVGPVSVLVNNAGMGSSREPAILKPFADYLETDWDRMVALSLKTAFCATRAFLPAMLDAGYGRVINVASTSGAYVANPNEVAYAAAKAGMVGLTKALAVEVASRGVTVTAVAPGWIATAASTDGELAGGLNTPTGRAGTPDEVAHAVAFLASKGASYINGETLVIDGANILQEYKGPAADYY